MLIIKLSPKQREVMQYLVEGRSLKEIAHRMGIGLGTVQKYFYRVITKTEAKSKYQCIAILVSEGIVTPKMEVVFEKPAVELLREARHYALQVREISKVHVTIDFHLHLIVDKDYGSIAPIYNIQDNCPPDGPMPLFGRPCEVHREPREKPFWFEGDDGKEIVFVVPTDKGE